MIDIIIYHYIIKYHKENNAQTVTIFFLIYIVVFFINVIMIKVYKCQIKRLANIICYLNFITMKLAN